MKHYNISLPDNLPTMIRRSLLLISTLLACTSAWASAKPVVAATLHPLALLTSALGQDMVQIETLMPASASPHTYQLKPSERQRLDRADLIIWIGPAMETFLDRLLAQPSLSRKTLTLWPEAAPSGQEPEQHDHTEDQHAEHAEHHYTGQDPHIWLDPALAPVLAEQIAEHVKHLPGVDAKRVDANLKRLKADLLAQDAVLRERLTPLSSIGLFTYHDAFSRFAAHYQLKIEGVLTLSPEKAPGARHLAELRQRLAGTSQPCLLSEPQFDLGWWKNLARDQAVQLSTWDPLGQAIPLGPEGFLAFQASLADAALGCIKP